MSSNAACSTTTGAAQQLFASAINFFAASQCFIANDPSSDYGIPDTDTFDFIVVGAGSAGSVVASRLSEIYNWNVLLLEAGPEPPIEADIPYLYPTMLNSKFDWQYIPKSNCVTQQALKNGTAPWHRGKMLGGSSSINYMFYVRPRDCDFETWSNEGNPSWSVENVNLYMRRAENFQDTTLNEDSLIYNTYGHDGPLVINSYNMSITDSEILDNILDSWDCLGVRKVLDINSAYFEGSGISGVPRVTAKNGHRQSTYNAYLQPVRQRDNLKIVTHAFVTKILINNNTQAYGVEVDINGEPKTFFSTREVIISAGAINTPQLLMLSGVGPKEHLEVKNIPLIVDLPGVGKNLQDHLSIHIPIYGDESRLEDTVSDKMYDVINYLHNKSGYLAHGTYPGVISLFSRNETSTCPELQTHLAIFWKKSSTLGDFLNLFNNDVADSIAKYNLDNAAFVFIVNKLHPFSTGSIYLDSSNPYDHPIIDPNYLSDERDIEAVVDGIKTVTKLLNTSYFQSINAFIPRLNISQCNEYEFLSDLYWRCYAIHMVSTIFHPVGTAKMGPCKEDSVVDNFLKVHDIGNLRVIDASIMPTETSGNTNSPTIMIGEFGSDMIKADHFSN